MDYSGPEPADFANVTSLNHAFLMLLRKPAGGQSLRQKMTARLRPIARDLTDLQLGRLSATPFMLMSLRERDAVTVGLCLAAAARGAHLLRVHDVVGLSRALIGFRAVWGKGQ